MFVTPLQIGSFKLVEANQPYRPPGLHLSDIISDMMKRLDPKRYDKRDKAGTPLPMNEVKIGAGISFEQALEKTFKPAAVAAFRPEPILVDGIWCSPDHVEMDPYCVSEFKCTEYSAKKEFPYDDVYWPWLVQTKGYGKALGTGLAKVWVMYMHGDYAPPTIWEPKVWGLEFSEMEIEENWLMLVNHAKAQGWL